MKLYHGTSRLRTERIANDGLFKPAVCGFFSMTTRIEVAYYFAHLALMGDQSDHGSSVPSHLDIFEFEAMDLRRDGFELILRTDDVFGAGECDHECEVATVRAIPVKYAMVYDLNPRLVRPFSLL